MKRSVLLGTLAACACLGLVTPVLAAQPLASDASKLPAPTTGRATGVKSLSAPSAPDSSQKCLDDLQAFHTQTQKDGYWLGGSGAGYGYPLSGLGYGYAQPTTRHLSNYENARPGYEVRMLIVSANILARHGQQKTCESVLSTAGDLYKVYLADMRKRGAPMTNTPVWWKQQIAAAQAVTASTVSFRSDELIGTEVHNSQDDTLGTVNDIVMEPASGKIAYLVIGRGGVFGIGEKYVPVPWANFKSTPTGSLLVLDATKDAMDGAPQVEDKQFSVAGQFSEESRKVDAYWKAHLGKNNAGTSN